MNHKRTLEDELFYIGLIVPAVLLAWASVDVFVIRRFLPALPCFFSTFLGIYCPGCGGTRAVEALLHGRILSAVWYHPLIPYAAAIYAGFMLTQGLHRMGFKRIRGWKYHDWYLWGGVVIMGMNFVIKNVLRIKYGIMM